MNNQTLGPIMRESRRPTASTAVVSVIVVNCNGAEETADCVESLLASSPAPSEIIVVDNGSTDGSVELIGQMVGSDPPVRLIALSDNLGPAEARNIGAGRAVGTVLAFLDNDTVVHPKWIAQALDTMDTLMADCIQCKLVMSSDRSRLDSLGYLIGPFGFPRHIIRPGAPDRKELNVARRLFGVKSAGMLISRDSFFRAGGFDATFFIYGEETDLCWRLLRAGGLIALAPTSIVFHNAGGTRRLLPSRAEELLYRGGTRNYIRMVVKNSVPRRLVFDVFGQVAVWCAVAIFQAVRGNVRPARLIFLGIADALHELPPLLRNRRSTSLPFIGVPKDLRMGFGMNYIWRVLRAV